MVLAPKRYRAFLLAASATLALALGGCTSANFSSIHRNLDTLDGTGVLTDAKQRAILVGGVVRDPAFANEAIFLADDPDDRRLQNNGVDHKFFRPRDVHVSGAKLRNAVWQAENARGRIVCAEPSPDALTVLAASAAAQVDIEGKGSGSLAAALSEAGGSMGLRTQSIQLLRDELFRICEAYMNGAIGEIDYRLMKRRVQSHVIALLAIEQLTGPVTPPALRLGSESSSDAGTLIGQLVDRRTEMADQLASEQQSVSDNNEELKDQKKIRDDEGKSDEDRAAAREEIKSLEEENKKLLRSIDSLKKGVAAFDAALADPASTEANAKAQAAFTAYTDRQNIDKDTVSAIAKEVGRIAQSVLNADYGAQVCLEYARSGILDTHRSAVSLRSYCNRIMAKYENAANANIKSMEAEYALDLELAKSLFSGTENFTAEQKQKLIEQFQEWRQSDSGDAGALGGIVLFGN